MQMAEFYLIDQLFCGLQLTYHHKILDEYRPNLNLRNKVWRRFIVQDQVIKLDRLGDTLSPLFGHT
jgi:hypothetical protein